jgi:hypothetical protein
MEKRFHREMSAMEARAEAQRLAFAPFMFQGVRVLVSSGVLGLIKDAGEGGVTMEALKAADTGLSPYAVTVLVETGLACDALAFEDNRYKCTKIGWFLLRDDLTRVNMSFAHSVCYKGLYHLEAALSTGKPAGLKALGDWPTVYEGLSELPDDVRKDWFAFDHYYSDKAFAWALPLVFEHQPRALLDIGGNTGKFAMACALQDPGVRVAICDLEGQLRVARANVAAEGLADRVSGHAVDLLSPDARLPSGYDTAWMSQFLCCFAEGEIVSILERAGAAVGPTGQIFIMDTFWDRQEHVAAAYSLIATSLYFTAIANGTSRMYHSDAMKECIERAGLEVVEERDNIGLGHTLLRCRRV